MSSRSPGFIQKWISCIFIFLVFFLVSPHAANAATRWAPTGGTTTFNLTDPNTSYIESTFYWNTEDLAGFSDHFDSYEHEITLDNISLIDCKNTIYVTKYNLTIDAMVAGNLLSALKNGGNIPDIRMPYYECLKSSTSVTKAGNTYNDYYVDTRILDLNSDPLTFAVGFRRPEPNKLYKVRFNVKQNASGTSSIKILSSIGHLAYQNSNKASEPTHTNTINNMEGYYAEPFNDIAEVTFCNLSADVPEIMSYSAGCTFVDRNKDHYLGTTSTNQNNTFNWGTWPANPGCVNDYKTILCGSVLPTLDPNKLYTCSNGNYSAIDTCSLGCNINSGTTNDSCKTSGTVTPPPGSCPNNQNGNYCGESVGKTAGNLYYCSNGSYTQLQVCAYGCQQNPQGTNDVCKTSTSTGSCPSGNGLYCGTTLGLNASTLYKCTNGVKTAVQVCNAGCQINAPGTNDQCSLTNTGSGEVILYGNSDYNTDSYESMFSVGKYNTDGKQYKSMKLPSGWSVYLYDQSNQGGNRRCWNTSEPFLQNQESWYNRIRSLEVFATDTCPRSETARVELYKSTGYSGGSQIFTNNAPSLGNAGFGNDDAESIRIEGDWVAVLFWDDNYNGTFSVIDGSRDNLDSTNVKRNQASSILVRRKDTNRAFTLHSLGDLNGESWSSDRTIYDFGKWNWNDKAQSIRVYRGYQTILCSDANFEGVCTRTPYSDTQDFVANDINSVAYGLRNGLSSVMVCKGLCPQPPRVSTLNLPAANSNIYPETTANFVWTPEINGDRYMVRVWGGALPGTIDSGWITATNWQKALTKSANPYYWSVSLKNPYGSTTSSTSQFYIKEPAPTEVLVFGPQTAKLNQTITIDSYIKPVEAQNLTYVWSPEPLTGQGSSRATYNFSTSGNKTISLTVSNSAGSQTGSLMVNVDPNYAPTEVLLFAPTQVEPNAQFAVSSYVKPFNARNLTYSWSPEPVSGQGTDTAFYSFTNEGDQTVSLNVSNPLGSLTAQQTITVFDTQRNYAPTNIQLTAPSTYKNGENFTVSATVFPERAKNLNYIWSPEPVSGQGTTQAIFNLTGREIKIVTLDVYNEVGNAYSEAQLDPYNTAPSFSQRTLNTTAGQLFTYQINAVDDENDQLNYRFMDGPPGITISSSGLLTWTPTKDNVGSNLITVMVSDFGLTGIVNLEIIVEAVKPGLIYKYYEGNFTSTLDLNNQTPLHIGEIHNFVTTPKMRADNFGFEYEGCIDLATSGSYRFYSLSDEGSRLWINGRELVNNDGLHIATEKYGNITLSAGKHAIKVRYFDAIDTDKLTVRYQGPGIVKQLIPNTLLTQNGCAITSPNTGILTNQGLKYNYYETSLETLPDLAQLSPIKQSTIYNFDIGPRNRNDNFVFEFTGCIELPTRGSYRFYTQSDDGSKLYIGNNLVVNNDGQHASIEKYGDITLDPGKHPIKVQYFDYLETEILRVRYKGPGIIKQLIPNIVLTKEGCSGTNIATVQPTPIVTATPAITPTVTVTPVIEPTITVTPVVQPTVTVTPVIEPTITPIPAPTLKFEYPINDQILGVDGWYMFKTESVTNAITYKFTFEYLDTNNVWVTVAHSDDGDQYFNIAPTSTAHTTISQLVASRGSLTTRLTAKACTTLDCSTYVQGSVINIIKQI